MKYKKKKMMMMMIIFLKKIKINQKVKKKIKKKMKKKRKKIAHKNQKEFMKQENNSKYLLKKILPLICTTISHILECTENTIVQPLNWQVLLFQI